jgi:hypothetical protein
MADPCGCVDPEVTGCQCVEEATSTITPDGAGSPGDPRTHDVNLDPDTRNQIEDTGTGLLVVNELGAARIRNTVDQPIVTGDWVEVDLTDIIYDYGNYFDSDNGFTVPVGYDGVHMVTFHVEVRGGTGSARIAAAILKQGVRGAIQDHESTAEFGYFSVPFLTHGAAGEVFRFQVKVNAGTGFEVMTQDNYSAYASIAQVNQHFQQGS